MFLICYIFFILFCAGKNKGGINGYKRSHEEKERKSNLCCKLLILFLLPLFFPLLLHNPLFQFYFPQLLLLLQKTYFRTGSQELSSPAHSSCSTLCMIQTVLFNSLRVFSFSSSCPSSSSTWLFFLFVLFTLPVQVLACLQWYFGFNHRNLGVNENSWTYC